MTDPGTTLEWKGWQRSASEALMHATSADPAQVTADAEEAIKAGQEALKVASNPRQRAVTESLLNVAHAIKRMVAELAEDEFEKGLNEAIENG